MGDLASIARGLRECEPLARRKPGSPLNESVNRLVRNIVSRWRQFVMQSVGRKQFPCRFSENLARFDGCCSGAFSEITHRVNFAVLSGFFKTRCQRSAGHPKRKSLPMLKGKD
jgi:hypothetical protein